MCCGAVAESPAKGLSEPVANQREFGGEGAGTIALQLPVEKPDAAVPVVELILK